MKAWQLNGIKNIKLVQDDGETESEYRIQIPAEEHIKVKITKSAITSSDCSAFLGNGAIYPLVLGRSAAALVSESQYPSFKTGQKIYLSPYCETQGDHLTRGIDIDGYLADYAIVPLSNVYTLPEGLADNNIIFIEDIALAINALERIDLKKGEYVMLYGASHLNIIIAQLAIYYQSIPIIVDKDNDRLTLAEDSGVYYAINQQEEILSTKLLEITAGKRVNHLILDTDALTDIDELMDYVKPRGTVCLVGFNRRPGKIQCDIQRVIANQLVIIGIHDGYQAIPSAINMIANKIIKTEHLIEATVEFTDVKDAVYNLSDKTNYRKTLVNC